MKRICCFLAFLCGICVTCAGRADWYSEYDMFRNMCESTFSGTGNTEAVNCCIQQNFFQTTWSGTQCNCVSEGTTWFPEVGFCSTNSATEVDDCANQYSNLEPKYKEQAVKCCLAQKNGEYAEWRQYAQICHCLSEENFGTWNERNGTCLDHGELEGVDISEISIECEWKIKDKIQCDCYDDDEAVVKHTYWKRPADADEKTRLLAIKNGNDINAKKELCEQLEQEENFLLGQIETLKQQHCVKCPEPVVEEPEPPLTPKQIKCKWTETVNFSCSCGISYKDTATYYTIHDLDTEEEVKNYNEWLDEKKREIFCKELEDRKAKLIEEKSKLQADYCKKNCPKKTSINAFGIDKINTYDAEKERQRRISEARLKISEFTSGIDMSKKSAWKTAEGKFNTARLASDLTAGVVLGTVGGVVSGVVIKKKQVEKGFDALHCTVAGQPIADWGDTFNVGLRR